LVFRSPVDWRVTPIKADPLRPGADFPIYVELKIETEGLELDLWHEAEIEVAIKEPDYAR